MKQLAILLLAFGFVFNAVGQALPDNPVPVSPSDPAWSRLQSTPQGEPVVVSTTNGPPIHCLFVSVTDDYLFCNPPGNPLGAGFRFDHADVLGVDLDLPHQMQSQVSHHEHNYHPGWISSMIAGGMIVGIIASQNTDAGRAAQDGLIGAGIVGLIGAPLAFLPHPDFASAHPAFPIFGVGMRFRRPALPRLR